MSKYVLCCVVGVVALCLAACNGNENYSKQLKMEKVKIEDYLKRNGYEVVSEFPQDSVFPDNVYYHKGEDEIYFRLVSKGSGDTIKKCDKLEVRYIQSTLDEHPIVENYWTTMDLEYPIEVTYGDITSDNSNGGGEKTYANSCEGWNDAFAMMQKHGAVAEIIVPSYKGFEWAITTSGVTPYYYKLTFKVLPK